MKPKHYLSIALFLFLFIPQSEAQFVTIPDANFVTWLNTHGYSGCMNGNQMDTTCSAVVNATTLACTNSNINNLTAIRYFDKLTTLDFSFNQVQTIPVLPPLLVNLYCVSNQLTSLPSLPSSLVELYCTLNSLSSLPALPASLKRLDCSWNQITSLPTLPPAIIELKCYYNLLTNLPFIPHTLLYFDCHGNNLTFLPTVFLHSIYYLDCSDNNITAVGSIPSNLQEFYCFNNNITSLPALPSSLKYLYCGLNQLTEITSLPSSMIHLDISNNPALKCLPPINSIQSFDWTNTGITCLPNQISVSGATPSISGLPLCSNASGVVPMTGTQGFCRPSTGNIYSIAAQNGSIYSWTLPAGATITSGQGTNSIAVSFASNAAAGTISVTASGTCGSVSASKTLAIRSSVPSAPGTITGSNNGCYSESKIYSIKKVSTADSYLWTPPLGASINGSGAAFATADTFITVYYGASFAGDTLRVRGINCKGMSAERKLRINHNPPSTPGAISGLTIGLCNKSGNIYSVAAVTNAKSYTWRTNIAGVTFNGNAAPYTTTNTYVTVNFGTFTTGQIYVKANNGCGSSAERSLTVNAKPAVPSIINGLTSVCDGQQGVAYSTSAVTNATAYNWTVPPGATVASGQTTTNITVNFGANPATGNVRVRSQNACASSAYLTKSITINNCPRMGTEEMSEIKIQPNPFTESTMIYLPEELELTKCRILLNDLFGREILNISSPGENRIQIARGTLAQGVYQVVLIYNEKISGTAKIVAQ